MSFPTRAALILLAAILAGASACDRRRATAEDCQAIFARLVELEMEELGFHDPVALARTKERLSRDLAPRIASCKGRHLKASALACVQHARRAEEITHACLE